MRKLLIVLIIMLCCSPLFAWKLVLDTSNLLQAIVSYTEKISEINQEIQYWRTQYTRIARAAEGLVSGDFSTVLSSIASLTGTTSRMKGVEGNARDILSSIENDSLNLLDVYKTVNGYDIVGITEAIRNKIEYIQNLSANGFKDFTYGGNAWDEVVSYGQSVFDAASLATNYVTKLGNVASSTKTFVDELFTIRRSSERLKAIINLKNKLIAEFGNETDINNTIAKYKNDISHIEKEMGNLSSEDSTKIFQSEQSIKQYENKIQDLEKIKELLREINQKETELREQSRLESIKEFEEKERDIERKVEKYIREKSIIENININTKLDSILSLPIYAL